MANRKSKNKGVLVYNKILKEFTKINNQLPEDRKLSLGQRRKLISETIYPSYQGTPPSRIGIRSIRASIITQLEQIPPSIGCDPNLIEPSTFASIGVFEIDEWITTIIPDCIYIKISAGEFGETKIFNTRDYSYIKSGVRDIVENIRQSVDDKNITSDLVFQGIKKLKRNKPNDGTPENYYIDLVLYIGDNPTADTQVIEYEVPRNRETQKQKTKIRNVINERLKTLSSKKRKRKRATKSHRKNVSELKNLKKRYKRTRKPQSKQDINNKILERFNRFNSALDRDYNNGLMTEEQYIYRKNQLYDNYLKNGGII